MQKKFGGILKFSKCSHFWFEVGIHWQKVYIIDDEYTILAFNMSTKKIFAAIFLKVMELKAFFSLQMCMPTTVLYVTWPLPY